MLPPDPTHDRATDPLLRLPGSRPYFLRREALAAGHTDRSLARLMRAGVIRRIRYGTYALADEWDPLRAEERHLVLVEAALARMEGVVLSHVSAALLHGMDVWGVDLGTVHVTRTDGGSGRLEAGVLHHECFSLDQDLVVVGGIPVVNPARAALETGLLGGTEAGLVTTESGLRRWLFTLDDLAREYRLLQHWPGARPLQLVHRLADPTSESVAETRCGYLIWRLGFPAPVRQLDVFDARGVWIGRVDFAWPEHRLIVEFDGEVKYRRLRRPGERIEDAVVREKQREDALRAAGWMVIRLTWSDLSDPARVESLLAPYLRRPRVAVRGLSPSRAGSLPA